MAKGRMQRRIDSFKAKSAAFGKILNQQSGQDTIGWGIYTSRLPRDADVQKLSKKFR